LKPFWLSALATLLGLAIIVGVSCYKPGPNPPPCTNIMGCDDPTAPPWPPPPMMAKKDAGADGSRD